MHNSLNTIRLLDEYIAVLTSLRKDIAEENTRNLQSRLDESKQRRTRWQSERAKGDWLAVESGKQEMPSIGNVWKQQIGGLDKLFGHREKKKPGEE